MLTGTNVFLRPPEPSDLGVLYDWENNPDLWRVSDTLSPYSKHQISEYLNDPNNDIFMRKQLRFMICLVENEEPVGSIDLFDFQPMHQRIGIGVFITEKHRHQGLAAESIEVTMEYCRKTLKIKQVWCNIPVSNTPSIQLFEGLGFQLFGTGKEWIRTDDGAWEDVRMYQKLLF